ncbi:class I SAM-dependent methyltransferase [Candidatus Curtissbacteria bacterium]|nr:class I SAM-dependent methyltransferase [Candidatus Curtissbacteria bacterium]
MQKNTIFYDSYERHRKVGSLIKSSTSILDVGGQLNALAQFCDSPNIVVANLKGSEETSDVTIKGKKLPFPKDKFDVVCSIDVLEHIPKSNRKSFIDDLIRVSKNRVILSFPIGTTEHINYENKMHKWLKNKDFNIEYLKEHIKLGLPQKSELEKILKGRNYKIFYSGDIKINEWLFKLFIFDPKVKFVRKGVYFSKLFFNYITNPLLYLLLATKDYSKSVNRAYLVINKK